jgi:DNA-binding response OmpR family regulator
MKVLIVEDDPRISAVLEYALKAEGLVPGATA